MQVIGKSQEDGTILVLNIGAAAHEDTEDRFVERYLLYESTYAVDQFTDDTNKRFHTCTSAN